MTGSDREIQRKNTNTNTEVERALDYLRDNAKAMGEARQRMVSAAHFVKHVEAIEFKLSNSGSAEARKADARASERYVDAITEDAIATGEYEKMRALREAAALKIEVYRTESANYRAMKL